MSEILDLLTDQLGSQSVRDLSRKIGASENAIRKAAAAGGPVFGF